MAKVGVCVVGGGRIGTIHIDSLRRNPRARISCFVDVDEKRRNEVAALEDGIVTAASLEEAIDRREEIQIDGVIICSPTAHHFAQVKLCIANGIPIMCEKPLSMNHEEIGQAYHLASEANVPLLCGYQRRHDPSYVALEKALSEGKVGDVRTIRSCSRDNPVPSMHFLKISGGIMHDCASHDIDLCLWMAKEDPCEVFAMASAFNKEIGAIDDWDTVMITLKFPSGKLASIELSRHAPYGYDQRLEVLGVSGMLQVENRRPTTLVTSLESGISVDPNCFSFPQRYTDTYAIEVDHFLDIIQKGVQPKVDGESCRKVAIIADRAHEACKLGKPLPLQF
mmetsp:Transcript_15901/g.62137  ORF Transcript_15901/g.62137 Transcript_15901/m.62137 type:complete len:337 (+) Transcript_15901:31-1041(+)